MTTSGPAIRCVGMNPTTGYRGLIVWKRARQLAVDVFRATMDDAFRRDFALRDQLRRSAVSVPSNIAEGSARGTNADSIRFFYFARGSLAELATQLDIAHEVGFVDGQDAAKWLRECDELGGMIRRLIRARS